MPEFKLATIDIAMIGIYVVFIVAVGIYVAFRTRTTTDYFLAGRSLSWWLIGFSLFASNVSSSTLVGLSSSAYDSGIAVYNYEWMAALVMIVFVLFFLPLYLKSRVFTMPEFLERRFDARTRYYFSGLMVLMNITIDTAAALYAGALVVQLLYPDVPLWASAVILGVLAGLYTIAGGLRAVVYTDAVQAVLLLVGSTLVAVLSFNAVGSWSAVTAAIPESDLSIIMPMDHPTLPWPGLITGVFLLGFYFWATNQFMVQRTLAARDINNGRWGALFAGFLKLPIIFIMVLPGIFGRILYPVEEFPALANPDLIFPTMMFDLLPHGLRGLIIAALLAAIMSSVDSTLNSASTLVTMDFIKKLRPDIDNRGLVISGRIVTFTFMALAVAWAPQIINFPNLWTYLQAMLAYLSPPVVACFLLGVFWPRASRGSAFAGLLTGHAAAAITLLMVISDSLIVQTGPLAPAQLVLAENGVPVLHFLYLVPLLLIISVVAMIGVSLLGQRPDPQQVLPYTWTRGSWKQETIELKGLPFYQNYRILCAALLVLVALFIVVFW